jgi:hypothetical protein
MVSNEKILTVRSGEFNNNNYCCCYSICIYLRNNLTAELPITKFARAKKGNGTQKGSLYHLNNNNNNNNSINTIQNHYHTSRKVAGSSPDEVIGFFSIDLILPAALWF